MRKDFVPHKQALALKDLGFDEPCQAIHYCMAFLLSYELLGKPYGWKRKELSNLTNTVCKNIDNERLVTVPTFSQVFRWFREKYELFHSTVYVDDNSGQGTFIYEILNKKGNQQQSGEYPEFDTYEEAELACLSTLIEIVKNKN